MGSLYLVGNGFDLYHGLPSDYYYFGCYLIKNYPEFYEEIGRMYGLKTAIGSHFLEDFKPAVEYDLFWRTFEERLGKLNSTWLECSLLDDLGLECNDPVDIGIPEVDNSEKIKRIFNNWVNQTLNTATGLGIVRQNLGSSILPLSKDAMYVNFNYTPLLESIYQIPESGIVYLHGKASPDEYREIVVGHGNKEEMDRLHHEISAIERGNDYLSFQSVRNRLNEYRAELQILKSLRKDTGYHCSRLVTSLRGKDFVDIYIMGLSCGSVDLPYIECLREKYPTANWHFSYYDGNEKKKRRELAANLSLPTNKVDYFLFRNDNSETIKQMIIDLLDIKTYEKI